MAFFALGIELLVRCHLLHRKRRPHIVIEKDVGVPGKVEVPEIFHRGPTREPVRHDEPLVGGWSAVRPALCYNLCAREEADAVLTILVKVAES